MNAPGKLVPVPGGVTAAAGFLAATACAGIQPGNRRRPDLAVICSEEPAVAAAVFTTGRFRAAPVKLSATHLRSRGLRAVVVNSGNANAYTGIEGIEHAKRMARATAALVAAKERQVLVCSTGRTGVALPIEAIERALADLAARPTRGLEASPAASKAAARAIMTTDTFPKEFAVRWVPGFDPVVLPDGSVAPALLPTFTLGGIAKGSGRLQPNLATLLCVLTTDVTIVKKDLQRALRVAAEQSFNRVSVDGHPSTNDAAIVLANGRAGGPALVPGSGDFDAFQNALNTVTRNLARLVVEDGEGITRTVEVRVSGALTFEDARRAAQTIAQSVPVKCSWHAGDPNWGLILDALGHSGVPLREEMVDLYYNGLVAVQSGTPSRTPADKLREVVSAPKFTVHVHLHLGLSEYVVYTTDLSPDYVRLNRRRAGAA